MELFKYDNMEVRVDPKALYIKAFKDIWKKYRNKETALAEFAYIWVVGSYTSDFASILDPELRRIEVIGEVYGGDTGKLKLDDKTELAIEKLEMLQGTPALSFLKSSLEGLQKIEILIKEADLQTTKDGEGLANLISKVPALIVSLEELTERIHKEAAEGSKIKGGRKKGIFEDASKQ